MICSTCVLYDMYWFILWPVLMPSMILYSVKNNVYRCLPWYPVYDLPLMTICFYAIFQDKCMYDYNYRYLWHVYIEYKLPSFYDPPFLWPASLTFMTSVSMNARICFYFMFLEQMLSMTINMDSMMHRFVRRDVKARDRGMPLPELFIWLISLTSMTSYDLLDICLYSSNFKLQREFCACTYGSMTECIYFYDMF